MKLCSCRYDLPFQTPSHKKKTKQTKTPPKDDIQHVLGYAKRENLVVALHYTLQMPFIEIYIHCDI